MDQGRPNSWGSLLPTSCPQPCEWEHRVPGRGFFCHSTQTTVPILSQRAGSLGWCQHCHQAAPAPGRCPVLPTGVSPSLDQAEQGALQPTEGTALECLVLVRKGSCAFRPTWDILYRSTLLRLGEIADLPTHRNKQRIK